MFFHPLSDGTALENLQVIAAVEPVFGGDDKLATDDHVEKRNVVIEIQVSILDAHYDHDDSSRIQETE